MDYFQYRNPVKNIDVGYIVMEEITNDNNKVIEDSVDSNENDFSYNFINIPWDDRTKRSKVFAIFLLVTIFVVTMALVINNFVTHYKSFVPGEAFKSGNINCNLVKVDQYPYVARIHSVSTQEMICVGALISDNSILTIEECLQSGPIRVYAGSTTDQRCKKGYSVGVVERLPHDEVESNNLVVLSTENKMSPCTNAIGIGEKLDGQLHAFIIGRPLRGERSLARQLVTLHAPNNGTQYGQLISNSRDNKSICVKHLSRCPVRAGDLLVQRGRLLGLAASTKQEANKVACFANVSSIRQELKQLDKEISLNI